MQPSQLQIYTFYPACFLFQLKYHFLNTHSWNNSAQSLFCDLYIEFLKYWTHNIGTVNKLLICETEVVQKQFIFILISDLSICIANQCPSTEWVPEVVTNVSKTWPGWSECKYHFITHQQCGKSVNSDRWSNCVPEVSQKG